MKSESEDTYECKQCHELYELGDGLEPTDYCNTCAQELVSTLRTQLKSVEAGAAVMREACEKADEALEWSEPYKGTCCGSTTQEECREMYDGARGLLEKALATSAGKSLLLRLQEAEWLLDHCPDSLDPNPMVNKQWWSRRDALLNPKPQDVK